jgi:replication factor A1
MYVEIPPEDIPYLKPHLQEGKIVDIKRFLVQRAKNIYKVVEAPYMIKLTQRSIITPVVPEPPDFLKYVYNLIPFSELPHHANLTDRFLGNIFLL